MADRKDHLEKAKWNENFLNELIKNKSTYVDWIVVVSFYIAVHYIDAKLADTLNFHPNNHTDRESKLLPTFNKRTASNYLKLSQASRKARYIPAYTRNLKFNSAKKYADIALLEFAKKFPNL